MQQKAVVYVLLSIIKSSLAG